MDRHDAAPGQAGDNEPAAIAGGNPDRDARRQRVGRQVRSVEAAAVAGGIYSVLAVGGLSLLSRYPSLDGTEEEITAWFDDSTIESSVTNAGGSSSVGPPSATPCAYFDRSPAGPLLITGAGGTGKSALMAWAAQTVDERASRLEERYVGITPAAGIGATLEADLAAALDPPDRDEGGGSLRDALSDPDVPTTVTIDGLDLLDRNDELRLFAWLPGEWPPTLHLLLSSRDDLDRDRLERVGLAVTHVELEPVRSDEAEEHFDTLLLDAGRSVSNEQRGVVRAALTTESRPLFVRLLAVLAAQWSEVDVAAIPKPTLAGAIAQIFDELEAEERHGELLSSRALGLVAASRFGLSDGEVHDALSSDAAVVSDFRRRHPYSPPIDQLPDIAWSALRTDLSPYLSTRLVDGADVRDFFHLDLQVAATDRFSSGDAGALVHQRLADTFEARGVDEAGRWRPTARREARETGHHLLERRADEAFDERVTDSSFVRAAAGSTRLVTGRHLPTSRPCDELVGQLRRRAGRPATSAALDPARAAGALQSAASVLAFHPQSAPVVMVNAGVSMRGDLAIDGVALVRTDSTPDPIAGHSTLITALAVSAGGRHLLAGDAEGGVSWRSVADLEPRWWVPAHERWVTAVAISPDGHTLATGGDDGVAFVWDSQTADRRAVPFPQSATRIPQVQALTFRDDATLIVVHHTQAYEVDLDLLLVTPIPAVPDAPVDGVDLNEPDTVRLAPGRASVAQCGGGRISSGFVRVVDLDAGEQPVDHRQDARASAIAIAPDGLVLCSSVDGLRRFEDGGPPEPARVPAPLFGSLDTAGGGEFVGITLGNYRAKVVLIDLQLRQQEVVELPIESIRDRPGLVRADEGSPLVAVGWASGRLTTIDRSTFAISGQTAVEARLRGGAVAIDGTHAVGHVDRRPGKSQAIAAARHGQPPRIELDRHRDHVVGVCSAGPSAVASLDVTGRLVVAQEDGATQALDLQIADTAVSIGPWAGVDGIAIGTSEGRVLLVGQEPDEVDFGGSRRFGRVPVVAVCAEGDDRVAVALHNGLTGWLDQVGFHWRPDPSEYTVRPTTVALLANDLVADGNELGEVRVWSPGQLEPVLEWNAVDGEVAAIRQLRDGSILTAGASGGLVITSSNGTVRGVGIVAGGIAAVELTGRRSLTILRRDGRLTYRTIEVG